MDRDILFEKFLDNVELYFKYKRDLDRRIRASYSEFPLGDPREGYWQEYDMLDSLRMLARRALDEYVSSAPKEAEP